MVAVGWSSRQMHDKPNVYFGKDLIILSMPLINEFVKVAVMQYIVHLFYVPSLSPCPPV
jgi:hypothetical protein